MNDIMGDAKLNPKFDVNAKHRHHIESTSDYLKGRPTFHLNGDELVKEFPRSQYNLFELMAIGWTLLTVTNQLFVMSKMLEA